MTNVEISGLMSAHRKNLRARKERELHQTNEIQSKPWMREEKSGRCYTCLLYTSPSPRDRQKSRMPSSA